MKRPGRRLLPPIGACGSLSGLNPWFTPKEYTMTDEDVALDEQAEAAENDQELSDEDAAAAKLKAAIDVAVDEVGPLRKKLTITVPREIIDERVNEQFDELRQEAVVPGFRKGRAPLKLLEKRFGNDVGEQVGSNLMGGSYMAAVEKTELDTLGDPLVCVSVTEERKDDSGKAKSVEVQKLVGMDEAVETIKLPKEGPLVYSCEVEIRPTFDLPELEGIAVEKPRLEITDEDVDNEIKRILMLRGTFRPVEKGAVEADDVLVGELRVVVGDEVIKTEDNADVAARDQRYDGILMEGFGKAAIGAKRGDVVAVDVTIPDDYPSIDARNQKGRIELEIKDIKRLEVPTVDDETIKAIGFESADELRGILRTRMEGELHRAVLQVMRGGVCQYLLDNTKLEIPQGISQRQTERTVAQRMLELYNRGVPEADIFKQVDEMRTSAAEEADRTLRLAFIMDKIAKKLDIDVSEEEMNSAIAGIAQRRNLRFDRVRDELASKNHMSTLYMNLRDMKVQDALLKTAKVTEVDPPKQEAPKSAASDKKKKPAAKKATSGKSSAEKKKKDSE